MPEVPKFVVRLRRVEYLYRPLLLILADDNHKSFS